MACQEAGLALFLASDSKIGYDRVPTAFCIAGPQCGDALRMRRTSRPATTGALTGDHKD
jgi:hypothetical protein